MREGEADGPLRGQWELSWLGGCIGARGEAALWRRLVRTKGPTPAEGAPRRQLDRKQDLERDTPTGDGGSQLTYTFHIIARRGVGQRTPHSQEEGLVHP